MYIILTGGYIMRTYLENDTYIIMDDNDNIILKCKPYFSFPGNQIHLETINEIYDGPIAFLHFKEE